MLLLTTTATIAVSCAALNNITF